MASETANGESKLHLLTFNKIDSLLSNRECRKVEISSLEASIEEVANQISQLWKIDTSCFDIVCFGNILDGHKSLSSYGIANGTLVYLINKKEPPMHLEDITDEAGAEKGKSLHERCKALVTTLLNPIVRQELTNLADFNKRENFLTINPELRDNPCILGVFTDADLLKTYLSKAHIKTVLKACPNFLDIATNVSATFLEEINSNNATANLAYRGNVVNYSIDNDDDDDDLDDSDASSVSSANTSHSRSRAPSANPGALSSMLMNAYNRRQNNVITHDMLRNALNQTVSSLNVPNASNARPEASTSRSSLASTPLSGVSPSSSSTSVPTTTSAARLPTGTAISTANALINLAPQLSQMRELGITDEIVAIQALEATGGDVQAAINIIFSDFN